MHTRLHLELDGDSGADDPGADVDGDVLELLDVRHVLLVQANHLRKHLIKTISQESTAEKKETRMKKSSGIRKRWGCHSPYPPPQARRT